MEHQLHIIHFPMMAQGHMIPSLDMAKLLTSRGLKATIIATPAFAEPIVRARESGHDIGLSIIQFPPQGSSLPHNIVSLDQLTMDLTPRFLQALAMLQEPFERILQELRPDCLISDMFLPWTADSADNFGTPRLIFHGTSCFAICTWEQICRHEPHKTVSSDSELFTVPNLPQRLTFTRTQVFDFGQGEDQNEWGKLNAQMREADMRSYGIITNSFYELEPDYVDHYKNFLGRKVWHIGPLLLSSNSHKSKAQRGKKSAIDEQECLAWLDSRAPNSVVYICHGSMSTFTSTQLLETAIGIETSGQDFIWVVRQAENHLDGDNEGSLPEGFEERTKGKGMIIKGWAPQLMILDHPAIGAFVTHCGWNSTMEGICAGVPMVTWPVFAEQFFNEKLVTEVLKSGVSVGNKKWQRVGSEGVGGKAVAEAMRGVMVGEAALEMRIRAKHYQEMGRKAVEQGGSSYNSLNDLIQGLGANAKK